ncbi:Protein of unknown function, partial [Cotesia congregata]
MEVLKFIYRFELLLSRLHHVFTSSNHQPRRNISDWYKNHVTNALIRKIEEFCQEKSGWRLSEISNLVITMSKYQPLHAGISTFVRMPQKIINRHAVLNIENFDEYCFLWCVSINYDINSDLKTIHLLMIQSNTNLNMKNDDYDDYKPIYHFALINNLSALVRSSVTKSRKQHFFCDRCLNHFKIRESFE